jgi:hypothetical protein
VYIIGPHKACAGIERIAMRCEAKNKLFKKKNFLNISSEIAKRNKENIRLGNLLFLEEMSKVPMKKLRVIATRYIDSSILDIFFYYFIGKFST